MRETSRRWCYQLPTHVGYPVLVPARCLFLSPNLREHSPFSSYTHAMLELPHPFNSCYLLWNVLLIGLHLVYIKKYIRTRQIIFFCAAEN